MLEAIRATQEQQAHELAEIRAEIGVFVVAAKVEPAAADDECEEDETSDDNQEQQQLTATRALFTIPAAREARERDRGPVPILLSRTTGKPRRQEVRE
jgi:hypothetical protein